MLKGNFRIDKKIRNIDTETISAHNFKYDVIAKKYEEDPLVIRTAIYSSMKERGYKMKPLFQEYALNKNLNAKIKFDKQDRYRQECKMLDYIGTWPIREAYLVNLLEAMLLTSSNKMLVVKMTLRGVISYYELSTINTEQGYYNLRYICSIPNHLDDHIKVSIMLEERLQTTSKQYYLDTEDYQSCDEG